MATWRTPSRATRWWSRAIGWEAVAVWAKAKGKTINYTIPKEGTGMFMDCLCIPKDAPHLDLSYKMINHIISPEPQKHLRDRAERRHHQSRDRADAAGGAARSPTTMPISTAS